MPNKACYANKHVEWGVLFSCLVVIDGHGGCLEIHTYATIDM